MGSVVVQATSRRSGLFARRRRGFLVGFVTTCVVLGAAKSFLSYSCCRGIVHFLGFGVYIFSFKFRSTPFSILSATNHRVPMVFNLVWSSSREKFCYLRPPVSELSLCVQHNFPVVLSQTAFRDFWINVVDPSFSTLLWKSPVQMGCYDSPMLRAVLLHEFRQLLVFFRTPLSSLGNLEITWGPDNSPPFP